MSDETEERKKRGVFCIETVWYGVEDKTSMRPVLEGLQDSYCRVPVVYRSAVTKGELIHNLKEWKSLDPRKYPILYLGYHGESGAIVLGEHDFFGKSEISIEQLAQGLAGECNNRVIHFGSCSTLDADDELIQHFLDHTAASAISGYGKEVEWTESLAFDVLYIRMMQEGAFKLIDDLEGRAELFAALSDLHHGYWMELPEAKEYVRDLHLFRVRQAMPLLFTAWESFSAEDFVRVLKLVSVISFRYMVVGGLNPNALESACHRAAKAVMDGDARTSAAAFDHLKPVYVDDERTRRNFALLVVDTRGQKKLAKYILARLEQDVAARDCDPDTDPGSIEHILPENPVDAWGETFPADRWESSVYRLGNLTLLERAANRAAWETASTPASSTPIATAAMCSPGNLPRWPPNDGRRR